MASEIIVNTIKAPTTGANANKIIVGSGQELDASAGLITPSGHLIQFKKTAYITAQQASVSGAWADVTGASLSITPKYTSSIIIVGWVGHLGGTGSFRFLRDSTVIASQNSVYFYYDTDTNGQTNWANNSTRTSFNEQFYDTPATTNSVTYKVQLAAYTGASNPGFGINEATVRREGSHMYLMEIAQ